MHEIWKMTFRFERLVIYCMVMAFSRFDIHAWKFWIAVYMIGLVLDKFEDSVRREYNDSTKEKIIRLIKEQEDE